MLGPQLDSEVSSTPSSNPALLKHLKTSELHGVSVEVGRVSECVSRVCLLCSWLTLFCNRSLPTLRACVWATRGLEGLTEWEEVAKLWRNNLQWCFL